MLSSKFKQLHIVDGYKFRFQKTLANGVQRWLCSKSASQKCYAFLKFDVAGVMIEKRLEHNHEPDNAQNLTRQKVSNAMKRKAIDDICERPSKILHKAVSSQDLQLLNQRDVQYILKNAHNARMHVHPKLPQNFPELHESIPTFLSTLETKMEEEWLFENDQEHNILSLTTRKNLNFLKTCDSRFTNGEIDRLTYVKSLSRKFPPQNL
uniref:FLYWCH-type domain-containing protein n=1 Tax=Cacopsylla melanoneura TaxID=428564 RepID=A0A8D8S8W3_9HEMI